MPTLRRLVFGLIAALCISLIVFAFALGAEHRREQTDAEIWQNAVIRDSDNSGTKELRDIQKMPERRYLNEQL
ncbi:MAG TPA: hypothetical protein VF600_02010 [Abditibacteriaceae bacterium]|jgi:hypothetical protein